MIACHRLISASIRPNYENIMLHIKRKMLKSFEKKRIRLIKLQQADRQKVFDTQQYSSINNKKHYMRKKVSHVNEFFVVHSEVL